MVVNNHVYYFIFSPRMMHIAKMEEAYLLKHLGDWRVSSDDSLADLLAAPLKNAGASELRIKTVSHPRVFREVVKDFKELISNDFLMDVPEGRRIITREHDLWYFLPWFGRKDIMPLLFRHCLVPMSDALKIVERMGPDNLECLMGGKNKIINPVITMDSPYLPH